MLHATLTTESITVLAGDGLRLGQLRVASFQIGRDVFSGLLGLVRKARALEGRDRIQEFVQVSAHSAHRQGRAARGAQEGPRVELASSFVASSIWCSPRSQLHEVQ